MHRDHSVKCTSRGSNRRSPTNNAGARACIARFPHRPYAFRPWIGQVDERNDLLPFCLSAVESDSFLSTLIITGANGTLVLYGSNFFGSLRP